MCDLAGRTMTVQQDRYGGLITNERSPPFAHHYNPTSVGIDVNYLRADNPPPASGCTFSGYIASNAAMALCRHFARHNIM